MVSLSRTDTSVVGRWWWTVDRWMLVTVAMLIAIGYILTLAASPAVANRLEIGQLHFVERQAVYLSLAIPLMFAVSLLPPLCDGRRLHSTALRSLLLACANCRHV